MSYPDRSADRTLHIWDVNAPDVAIGGLRLRLKTTITHAIFREMLDIIIADNACPYSVTHRESETQVLRDSNAILARGNYDLARDDGQTPLPISQELALPRAYSHHVSPRDREFARAVRARDQTSAIGHFPRDADADMSIPDRWTQAAHIFPMAYERHLSTAFAAGQAFEAYRSSTGGTGTDSVRNGLLLEAGVHLLWDAYMISVSPRNGYRVISFKSNPFRLEETVLSERSRRPNDENAVCDDLLQWHFRQAVLANMKGAGEPEFEHDFPPGSDDMGEILQAPAAAKRMEFELFSRLAGYQPNDEEASEVHP